MKLNVSAEEWEAHEAAVRRGAIEGAAFGVVFATPGFYYLHRKVAHYRNLPLSLKVAGYVLILAPLLSIQAERRSLEVDRAYWSDSGKLELDRAAAEEEARYTSLSTKEKLFEWASGHQYSIIIGSWVLSMAAAGAIVARDKYMSLPQKAVQARMWAQGLTIGVLVVAGALTHQNRKEAASSGVRRLAVDHSWQTFLEQQAQEEQGRKVALSAQPSS